MNKLFKILFSFAILLLCGCKTNDTSLYSYKTEFVGDNAKVGNIINNLVYPHDAKNGSFEIVSEKEPYTLIVNIETSTVLTDADLKEDAILTFALIDNLSVLEYHEEDDDIIAVFTRADIDYDLKANGYQDTHEIGKSKKSFESFIESYNESNS